jgi:hypothetical protein
MLVWLLFIVSSLAASELRLDARDLYWGDQRLSTCHCYLWMEKEGAKWWVIRETASTFAEAGRKDLDRTLEFEKRAARGESAVLTEVQRHLLGRT